MKNERVTSEMIVKKFTEDDPKLTKYPGEGYGDIYTIRGGFSLNISYHLAHKQSEGQVELYVSPIVSNLFDGNWRFLQSFPDHVIIPILKVYNEKKGNKELEESDRLAKMAYEFFNTIVIDAKKSGDSY